ncbi:hypothetical protein [Aquincola sp. J276]|uniref:hypothetical protein n=1 Tax=Aquincola sp. J276 TaxID=2898432 RepID=UPI002150EDE7|nr:hypothetical protein [Aquincola sp. J276]MCR5868477.1 hypothetical protein [Aquincola sp. J276]
MEITIMEHTKELLSVPLASLVPSRFNVRRHNADQAAAHRTMALQAMLAQNTTVAVATVVHVCALRTFGADYLNHGRRHRSSRR